MGLCYYFIYDINGKNLGKDFTVVHSSDYQILLNVSSLLSGVYVIKIQTDEKIPLLFLLSNESIGTLPEVCTTRRFLNGNCEETFAIASSETAIIYKSASAKSLKSVAILLKSSRGTMVFFRLEKTCTMSISLLLAKARIKCWATFPDPIITILIIRQK